MDQSPSTVRAETERARAVSSTVIPAKSRISATREARSSSAASFSRATSSASNSNSSDLPHAASRDAEEVRPARPLDLILMNEPEIGLVDQRRGLEGVTGSLSAHEGIGGRTQLCVDQLQETFAAKGIDALSFAEFQQQTRNF